MTTTASESNKKELAPDSFSPADESGEGVSAAEREDASLEIKAEEHSKYSAISQQRRSDFQGHVHILSTMALYVVFGVYIIAILIWLAHFLLPEYIGSVKLHYLPDEDFNKLQSLLFGTLVGGVANQFSKKVFDD